MGLRNSRTRILVSGGVVSKAKTLSLISYLCLLVGFLLPFVSSGYVGMSLYKHPEMVAANAILWAVGLILGYIAHALDKKFPATMPAWARLASYMTGNAAVIVYLGLLWGYTYYPTMQNSYITNHVTYPLMLSLFVCGIQISKDHWVGIVRQPKFISLSVLVRWVAPLVSAYILGHFILARFLPHPAGDMLAIGMVILATTPTGPAGNTMVMIARGDLALSVSATAVNNVIAPFLQPFLIALFAGAFRGKVNTTAIFMELIELVLLPVILGSIIGGFYQERIKKYRMGLGAFAVVCLTFIMLANISKGAGALLRDLWILPWMLAACAAQAIFVLYAGYWIPKFFGFSMRQRVATTFDVAVENASLATVIGLAHFGPLAALPAIFYGKLQHVFGIGIFVRKFQNMPELLEEEQQMSKGAGAGK